VKLSKVEQETVINYNEAELTADIYTHNARLKQRLQEIAEQFPEECCFVRDNDYGGVTYRISKALIQVRKPYSKERREMLRRQALASGRMPPNRQNKEP
jgi:hypothetical protein